MLKRCYHHAQIEIEEREDSDLEFLKSTAADRARLFAERYEAAVFWLEWPVSSGSGGDRIAHEAAAAVPVAPVA